MKMLVMLMLSLAVLAGCTTAPMQDPREANPHAYDARSTAGDVEHDEDADNGEE